MLVCEIKYLAIFNTPLEANFYTLLPPSGRRLDYSPVFNVSYDLYQYFKKTSTS